MLFGEIAVEQGFVTVRQLKQVLDRQRELRDAGRPQLIGEIFVESGFLGADQVLAVLAIAELARRTLDPCEDDSTVFLRKSEL